MSSFLATSGPMLYMVGILVVFYFLMIIPERKRKKKYQSMLEELRIHDEIVTRGGIVGKITHIEDKYVTIETSNANTKIKFDKSGIASKLSNNTQK